MKKFFPLLILMAAASLSAAPQLFNNPLFSRFENIKEKSISTFRKLGITIADGTARPAGWDITSNSMRVYGGSISSSVARNRLVVKITAPQQDIIMYMGNRRYDYRKYKDSFLCMLPSATGQGSYSPVFFGYDQKGKCIFYRKLDAVTLYKNKMPDKAVFQLKDLPECTNVAVGFAIRGSAVLYAASMVEVTAAEAAEIKKKELAERERYKIGNGSFEKGLENWELKCHHGARGKIEAVANGKSGKALKITKLNGEGFLQLVCKQPVKVIAGKKYTLRGFYQCENSPLSTMMLFRVTPTADDKHFRYDDIDRSFGHTSQSLLINSAPGLWNKRLVSFQAKNENPVYINVVIDGNPASVVLDELVWEDHGKFFRPAPKGLEVRKTFRYTEKEVYDLLKKRPEVNAHLAKRNGRMSMMLNGKEVIPALYKSESFVTDYVYNRYPEFSGAGVKLVNKTISLNVVSQGRKKYDFAMIDKLLMYVLRNDPDANIWIGWTCNEPYRGWGEAHPDELWRNQKGQLGYGIWGNCDGWVDKFSDLAKIKLSANHRSKNLYPWPYPSYASELYRQEIREILTDLTRYVMNSPFRKAIAGFHIGGLYDGQFQYWRHDFGAAAQKKFRNFLKDKYKTVAELNRRCQTSYHSFEEINVPLPMAFEQKRPPHLGKGIFPDYKMFQQSETFGIKHEFADAVRKAAGKEVFVSAYGHPMDYQTETFFKYPGKGIDIYAVPSWYPFRLPGYPVGAKPDGGFIYRNKIWLNELDIRTWTEPSKSEVYDMWVGSMITPEWWQQAQRKFVGVSLAARQGWWYYSMYRYFDRPEVMADIKHISKAAQKVLDAGFIPFRPDVCVVRTERSSGVSRNNLLNNVGYPIFFQMMEISGVPYDLHNLNDILSIRELQDYKMYIFADTNYISGADRRKLAKVLKNGGKVLYFLDAPGFVDDTGKSVDNIRELTGFVASTKERFDRARAINVPSHPLNKGVPPLLSTGDVRYSSLAVHGVSPHSPRYQVFDIEDAKDGEILARYTHNGKTAAAIRKFDNWVSVYSSGPYASLPEFVNNLAAEYGCYRVAPAAQSIHMNGNFISIHGVRTGNLPLTLPVGVNKVTDLDSNKVYIPVNGKISVEVVCGKSIWLLLEK
ncbi:MAG: beta-galactosidase [Lentisphaeria bacterium]|nr:beta-galactosidase [Lentisphaeria bacterium]